MATGASRCRSTLPFRSRTSATGPWRWRHSGPNVPTPRSRRLMAPTVLEIESYVLVTLQELASDWDYAQTLDSETKLLSELGFESLDIVVVGAAIQEHFQCRMPFAELLAEIGRSRRDLSVGELVQFVTSHLSASTASVL